MSISPTLVRHRDHLLGVKVPHFFRGTLSAVRLLTFGSGVVAKRWI